MSAQRHPDEARAPFTEVEAPGQPVADQRDAHQPDARDDAAYGTEQTVELREEQLVAHKKLLEVGEITVRTDFEEVPGRLEVDAWREEIVIDHEPMGQIVSEREQPWEKDGVLVMPVYEEQLVVVKRLVLKERLHIRRVATTERQHFEDTLRRERLVVEDPQQTGRIREQYPTGGQAGEGSDTLAPPASDAPDVEDNEGGGLLEHLVRKALG